MSVNCPGAGIMEAEDRQVTTVFTVQPSFHHRHSTKPSIIKRYHRRRTCSHTLLRRLPTMVTLDDTRFCRVPMVECRLDCENCRHLTVVGLHDTGPRSGVILPCPAMVWGPLHPLRSLPRYVLVFYFWRFCVLVCLCSIAFMHHVRVPAPSTASREEDPGFESRVIPAT